MINSYNNLTHNWKYYDKWQFWPYEFQAGCNTVNYNAGISPDCYVELRRLPPACKIHFSHSIFPPYLEKLPKQSYLIRRVTFIFQKTTSKMKIYSRPRTATLLQMNRKNVFSRTCLCLFWVLKPECVLPFRYKYYLWKKLAAQVNVRVLLFAVLL